MLMRVMLGAADRADAESANEIDAEIANDSW